MTKARPRESRTGSRQERGYDRDWEKASIDQLRRFPLCQECEYAGRTVLADVADHKIRLRDRPDLRLAPKNRWSLCHHCHNGIKRRMEAYAAAHGLIDELILWCDDPTSRPKSFAERRPRREAVV